MAVVVVVLDWADTMRAARASAATIVKDIFPSTERGGGDSEDKGGGAKNESREKNAENILIQT